MQKEKKVYSIIYTKKNSQQKGLGLNRYLILCMISNDPGSVDCTYVTPQLAITKHFPCPKLVDCCCFLGGPGAHETGLDEPDPGGGAEDADGEAGQLLLQLGAQVLSLRGVVH